MAASRTANAAIAHRDLKPAIRVTVTYAPKPGTREKLVDLLVELLDERRKSGGTSK